MQVDISLQDDEGVEHKGVPIPLTEKVCLFLILMYKLISKVSF